MDTDTNTSKDEYITMCNQKFKKVEEAISKLSIKIDTILELLQDQTDYLNNVN